VAEGMRDEPEDVRDLALEFDQLVDQYIAADRWIEVQEMEQRMLQAYGKPAAMRLVIEDYFWEMNA
jgi:hypothetical protein